MDRADLAASSTEVGITSGRPSATLTAVAGVHANAGTPIRSAREGSQDASLSKRSVLTALVALGRTAPGRGVAD